MPKRSRLSRERLDSFYAGRFQRLRGHYFDLSYAAADEVGFATIVSKKVAPKATDRNRVRRQAREVMAEMLPRLSHPLAFVFTARKEALGRAFQDLRTDIQQLVERAVVSYNGPI